MNNLTFNCLTVWVMKQYGNFCINAVVGNRFIDVKHMLHIFQKLKR